MVKNNGGKMSLAPYTNREIEHGAFHYPILLGAFVIKNNGGFHEYAKRNDNNTNISIDIYPHIVYIMVQGAYGFLYAKIERHKAYVLRNGVEEIWNICNHHEYNITSLKNKLKI